jgi:hypothetical protein
MSQLSKIVGVMRRTLSNWRKKLQLQTGWRPSRRADAEGKRIFNNGEEDELVSKITTEFPGRNLFYCDGDFKVDALAFATELRSGEANVPLVRSDAKWITRLAQFKSTAPFICAFRTRHSLSLRRPALKRTPATNEEDVERFIQRVRN